MNYWNRNGWEFDLSMKEQELRAARIRAAEAGRRYFVCTTTGSASPEVLDDVERAERELADELSREAVFMLESIAGQIIDPLTVDFIETERFIAGFKDLMTWGPPCSGYSRRRVEILHQKDVEGLSFREIAERWNVCHQRIRDLYWQSRRRVAHPALLRHLRISVIGYWNIFRDQHRPVPWAY